MCICMQQAPNISASYVMNICSYLMIKYSKLILLADVVVVKHCWIMSTVNVLMYSLYFLTEVHEKHDLIADDTCFETLYLI